MPKRPGAQDGQRSVRPPGIATPRSCAHSRRTMPDSTSVIGSRSTRSETIAGGTFQSKASPKRPTGTSSNAGLGRTISTSSRAWSPRSRHWRSFETVMVKSYETLVDSDTKVDVHTGILRGGAVPGRHRSNSARTVGDEGQDGPDLQRGAFCCPGIDVGARSSARWKRRSGVRESLTSARTPSTTMTTTPTTRPSSSTRTTSFDGSTPPSWDGGIGTRDV